MKKFPNRKVLREIGEVPQGKDEMEWPVDGKNLNRSEQCYGFVPAVGAWGATSPGLGPRTRHDRDVVVAEYPLSFERSRSSSCTRTCGNSCR